MSKPSAAAGLRRKIIVNRRVATMVHKMIISIVAIASICGIAVTALATMRDTQ